VAQPRRRHEDIEQRLDAVNWNEPSRSRPVEEPQTHRPPPPPHRAPAIPPESKPVDPYEAAKEQFKINLFELLHWQVPMQGEGEIRRGDHASYYLVLDKCFEALFTGRLAALGFEPLDGKTQMLYMWFYWESYGKGYETCPLGNAELQKRLGWSRNTVRDEIKILKDYGKALLGYGIIEALSQFPPFEFQRPQVYKVHLPRIFIGKRIRKLEEEARFQAGHEGLANLRAVFERDPATREILPVINPPAAE
jgi:hypothetical protein